jgi:hypothetical protein
MFEGPLSSNADEWHLFLCEYLDSRATWPNGLTYMAVQIAQALDQAFEAGRALGHKLELDRAIAAMRKTVIGRRMSDANLALLAGAVMKVIEDDRRDGENAAHS